MHVFTYGSLMYRQVWDRVVSGAYLAQTATVRGFVRVRVSNEVYPALLSGPAESAVPGVVYLDVAPDDVATLDRFEDEGTAYRRIQVSVQLDDGRVVDAAAYVFLHPDRVESMPWEPERFEREGLQHFIDTYLRDRAL